MSKPAKRDLTNEAIQQFWLTVPSLWHNLRAHIDTEAEENFDITAEQFHSLRRISLGIDSVSALAEDKYISRSAVSRAVDVLVQKELVTREPHPADRRRLQLALTPGGQTLLEALTAQVQIWMVGKFDSLDEDELENIIHAFMALRKAFHFQGN
jgi:DNA-binding MarR family transcriptional regulator